MKIEVTGANGYGVADVEFDIEKFEADYEGKIKIPKEIKKEYKEYADFDEFEDLDEMVFEYLFDEINSDIDFDVSKKEKLSNGDEIVITIDECDEEYLEKFNLKLNGGEIKYSVKDLKEVEKIDAFKGVNVVFTGVSPNGTATVEVNGDALLEASAYSLDKREGLSNGDTVTVTISESAINQSIADNNKAPEKAEKEFKVADLPLYITKFSQINKDSVKKLMSQANDIVNADKANWSHPEWCKGYTYLGTYLLAAKDSGSTSEKNTLYLVYRIDADDEKSIFSFYWYIKYENVTVLPDGTLKSDVLKYEIPKYSWFSGTYFSKDGSNWTGYETYDGMYNDLVLKKADRYSCENTVSK